jgi:superfamily I DNA/RNA helicase
VTGLLHLVVGDDDQTIYQWRGSDLANILTFDRGYPDVDQIPLEENFRSIQGIIETTRPFIERNTARLLKPMELAGAQTTECGDIVGLSFADPDAEARHIVKFIQALRGVAFVEDTVELGLSWSDMASTGNGMGLLNPVDTLRSQRKSASPGIAPSSGPRRALPRSAAAKTGEARRAARVE